MSSVNHTLLGLKDAQFFFPLSQFGEQVEFFGVLFFSNKLDKELLVVFHVEFKVFCSVILEGYNLVFRALDEFKRV